MGAAICARAAGRILRLVDGAAADDDDRGEEPPRQLRDHVGWRELHPSPDGRLVAVEPTDERGLYPSDQPIVVLDARGQEVARVIAPSGRVVGWLTRPMRSGARGVQRRR